MASETRVRLTLSPGLQRLVQRGAPAVVNPAIARALDEQNELTIGQTVRERMSFPRTGPATMEGLRVQSGRLRRSLTRSRAVVTPSGVTSAIGSNVRYFGTHEFGFSGTQSVPAHQRRLPKRYALTTGQTISPSVAARAGFLTKGGKLRAGLGEELLQGAVSVRAHQRRVNIPAREMVQRTILARVPAYANAIGREVSNALS